MYTSFLHSWCWNDAHFIREIFYEHNVFLCLVYAVPAAVLPAGPGPVSEWSTGRVLRIFCADPEL